MLQPQGNRLSKAWLKWHRALALIALLPLVIMSVTGAILVFKTELDALLLPGQATLPKPQTAIERQPLDSLVASLTSQLPDYEVGTWELFDDGIRSDAVYLIRRGTLEWSKVFFDPYQGQVLSEPVALDHYFSDFLVDLHYRFLLGPTGALIGFLASLALLFLGLSGLKMHRHFYRKLFSLRWRGDWRVRNSSVHRLAGAWSAPLLIVLAFTGGFWNAEVLLHDLHEVVEPHDPVTGPGYSPAVSLANLQQQAQNSLPGIRLNYLVLPYEAGMHISFYGKLPGVNPLASNYSSGVSFDPDTARISHSWSPADTPAYLKVYDSFRALHFGDFGGLTSKIIWSFLGSMPLLLGGSGLYLYLRRRAASSVKQPQLQSATPSKTGSEVC